MGSAQAVPRVQENPLQYPGYFSTRKFLIFFHLWLPFSFPSPGWSFFPPSSLFLFFPRSSLCLNQLFLLHTSRIPGYSVFPALPAPHPETGKCPKAGEIWDNTRSRIPGCPSSGGAGKPRGEQFQWNNSGGKGILGSSSIPRYPWRSQMVPGASRSFSTDVPVVSPCYPGVPSLS